MNHSIFKKAKARVSHAFNNLAFPQIYFQILSNLMKFKIHLINSIDSSLYNESYSYESFLHVCGFADDILYFVSKYNTNKKQGEWTK